MSWYTSPSGGGVVNTRCIRRKRPSSRNDPPIPRSIPSLGVALRAESLHNAFGNLRPTVIGKRELQIWWKPDIESKYELLERSSLTLNETGHIRLKCRWMIYVDLKTRWIIPQRSVIAPAEIQPSRLRLLHPSVLTGRIFSVVLLPCLLATVPR